MQGFRTSQHPRNRSLTFSTSLGHFCQENRGARFPIRTGTWVRVVGLGEKERVQISKREVKPKIDSPRTACGNIRNTPRIMPLLSPATVTDSPLSSAFVMKRKPNVNTRGHKAPTYASIPRIINTVRLSRRIRDLSFTPGPEKTRFSIERLFSYPIHAAAQVATYVRVHQIVVNEMRRILNESLNVR